MPSSRAPLVDGEGLMHPVWQRFFSDLLADVQASVPSDDSVGFYSATAVAKPEITGSAASNAALESLLAELATMGIITDSST